LDTLQSRYLEKQGSFKLLIIGESGTGKTWITSRLVNTLADLGLADKITVIDMAPSYRGVGILMNVRKGVRLLRPARVYAPRLMGKCCEEVWRYAELNASYIRPLIIEYLSKPTPVLVINDLTIYLHKGDPELLYKAIDKSLLFIGNAYYGEKLKDNCGLWSWERKVVEELAEAVDAVWRL